MIGKVTKGTKVGGLLRYLYGPGRANEHTDPHLVAAWDEPSGLEPELTAEGKRDSRRLTGLLEHPLAAVTSPPAKPVWHCALRVAPGDRRLTDTEWGDVARDILDRTGLAPAGDDNGCRWVAVRHADDHIHLVVTLARQDGRAARTPNDFYRVGEACRAAEQQYGLTTTAARDRTAPKHSTRAESEKAQRNARREPPRVTLRREVRSAAAGAGDVQGFLKSLRDHGLMVRERMSERNPGEVTGYAVAWPGDKDRIGQPIWYGGGKLAADLTLPKLAARWEVATTPGQARQEDAGRKARGRAPSTSNGKGRPGPPGPSAAERQALWESASRTAASAAEQVRRLATENPTAAGDAAHAAADTLTATARVAEGMRGGPITDAADAYDRAARELCGRTPPRTPTGDGLRATARLLSMAGRASRDETTQVLALIANLAALADAVAALRLAQTRTSQAAAARDTAERLRNVAPGSALTGDGTATATRERTRTRPQPTRPATARRPPDPPRQTGPHR
jgi:hypothetical protein